MESKTIQDIHNYGISLLLHKSEVENYSTLILFCLYFIQALTINSMLLKSFNVNAVLKTCYE